MNYGWTPRGLKLPGRSWLELSCRSRRVRTYGTKLTGIAEARMPHRPELTGIPRPHRLARPSWRWPVPGRTPRRIGTRRPGRPRTDRRRRPRPGCRPGRHRPGCRRGRPRRGRHRPGRWRRWPRTGRPCRLPRHRPHRPTPLRRLRRRTHLPGRRLPRRLAGRRRRRPSRLIARRGRLGYPLVGGGRLGIPIGRRPRARTRSGAVRAARPGRPVGARHVHSVHRSSLPAPTPPNTRQRRATIRDLGG